MTCFNLLENGIELSIELWLRTASVIYGRVCRVSIHVCSLNSSTIDNQMLWYYLLHDHDGYKSRYVSIHIWYKAAKLKTQESLCCWELNLFTWILYVVKTLRRGVALQLEWYVVNTFLRCNVDQCYWTNLELHESLTSLLYTRYVLKHIEIYNHHRHAANNITTSDCL